MDNLCSGYTTKEIVDFIKNHQSRINIPILVHEHPLKTVAKGEFCKDGYKPGTIYCYNNKLLGSSCQFCADVERCKKYRRKMMKIVEELKNYATQYESSEDSEFK